MENQANQIENQAHEINELKLVIVRLESTIERFCTSQNLETQSLNTKYDIELPVTSEEDLEKVTTLLNTNNSFKKEFVSTNN